MARRKPQNAGRQIHKKRKPQKSFFFDYQLLFLVLFLVAFGLVMVYSTSSYNAQLKVNDAAHYLKRQGVFALAGLTAMLIVAQFDYRKWRNWTVLMMLGSIVLLVLVLLVGKEAKGATRWFQIGGIQFQPSEVAKIAIILFTAHISTVKSARMGDFKIMLKVMLVPMIAVALIALQNLSTAIICAAMVCMIVFVTSPKVKEFFMLAGGVVGMMVIFLNLKSYRLQRLKVWRNPEQYEDGYQTLQALYAIGSGGLFGKGLGQSIQKLGFIPESHNDMIFSVVCEELGLFGAACVIGVFIMLIWHCAKIAISAPDLYGALIVTGVTTHIAVQVIINIAVVTNSIPPTGVPLPFISYGGTALACLLVEMGLVLSVARQIHMPKEY